MTDLFRTLDDLKPFIFRITDNGGETADRYTVITNDGDYYAMSGAPFHPQGVGLTGEGINVQGVAERVEAGVERDIRWYDLPIDCQRCVLDGLNMGYADYIEAAPAAASREEALTFGGWSDFAWRSEEARRKGQPAECIYREGVAFRVRDDDAGYPNASSETDAGPFDTFAEAFRYILPEDYDLCGEEYHGTRDIWDTEGKPVRWNRDEEPPVIDQEEYPQFARVVIVHEPEGLQPGDQLTRVAWFATATDAENFLGTSATIDPDDLDAGRYTIDNLDDPDAAE